MYSFHKDPNLKFESAEVSKYKTQAGNTWEAKFFRAFSSVNLTAPELGAILDLPANDSSVKRALRTEGRSGLRPDQQRRFIGLQL